LHLAADVDFTGAAIVSIDASDLFDLFYYAPAFLVYLLILDAAACCTYYLYKLLLKLLALLLKPVGALILFFLKIC